MAADRPFHNLYTHGYVRIAVARPRVRVADPAYNGAETIAAMQAAAAGGATLVLFPELGLSAYTCDDLFHQDALLEGCLRALDAVAAASSSCPVVAVVGLPLRVDQRLYNCAAVVRGGRVLGIVPKSYLPNYAEFYEARQFTPAHSATADTVMLGGAAVPFSPRLLFCAANLPGLVVHAEICEDLWVPIPPSSYAALAGATLLLNLSASNITIGKAGYRQALVAMQSARSLSAYAYASAGHGESTTDLAWDGQAVVCENGDLLAQSTRFSLEPEVIYADVDLERLAHERMRLGTFGDSVVQHQAEIARWRRIEFDAHIPADAVLPLARDVPRFPYVPADANRRDERCAEVYSIQVQGLVQRMAAAGLQKLVIGISGGLDSTHALLVCAKAMDLLKLPRSNILGYTMPGFATSGRTLDQALRLMQAVGCTSTTIDIRPSCMQMLKDLGHPAARGEAVYDITFENVQAGERTSHLFRLANANGGMVVGTGDLSELALGWSTYGVGDHMSHYNVNGSVPKTLMKHLVQWVADTAQVGDAGSQVLRDVLATVVSPELVPGADVAGGAEGAADKNADAAPQQSTESVVGPYELQDFHLFHVLRYGFRPSKVAFLALAAWGDASRGGWPLPPGAARNAYTLADIKRHLRNFLHRYFQTSQFKRSCVPNGPKVGSGGSLSPRGDWRAPSDSVATVWLADLDRVPDKG